MTAHAIELKDYKLNYSNIEVRTFQ